MINTKKIILSFVLLISISPLNASFSSLFGFLNNIKTPMKNSYENKPYMLKVDPDKSVDWEDFLSLSVDYISEGWPEVFTNKSKDEFRKEYDQELRERITHGNRYLYLLKNGPTNIGLSNLYTDKIYWPPYNKEVSNVLNIAEFYIIPSHRRSYYGSFMVNEIKKIGSSLKCPIVVAEVDDDKLVAHKFWQRHLPYSVKNYNNRSAYWEEIGIWNE